MSSVGIKTLRSQGVRGETLEGVGYFTRKAQKAQKTFSSERGEVLDFPFGRRTLVGFVVLSVPFKGGFRRGFGGVRGGASPCAPDTP